MGQLALKLLQLTVFVGLYGWFKLEDVPGAGIGAFVTTALIVATLYWLRRLFSFIAAFLQRRIRLHRRRESASPGFRTREGPEFRGDLVL